MPEAAALFGDRSGDHDGAPRLSALHDTGLGISRDEIAALFAPFVAPGDPDGLWRREVWRRKRKIARRAAKRLAFGWLAATRRDEASVLEEYNQAWAAIDHRIYSLDGPRQHYTPWEWRRERLLASDVGATRFRQLLLIRAIERLRPRRVLEVGCGNGINLILLACRFPGIAFTGLELTGAGHAAAVRFQARHVELPEAMRTFAPLPLADLAGFRRVRFVQGDAAALPFDEGAFDLVYTVLALEQMERVRGRALAEIARTSDAHVLMIEPFRDVNRAFWPRLNVFRRDYFRGAIGDLPRYGLVPVLACDDFPQEALLKACVVLARRSKPAAPARVA